MEENVQAVLPDVQPTSLAVVENYLKQADEALTKINDSLNQLKAALSQREKEFIVITGQRDLLLALQKQFATVVKV